MATAKKLPKKSPVTSSAKAPPPRTNGKAPSKVASTKARVPKTVTASAARAKSSAEKPTAKAVPVAVASKAKAAPSKAASAARVPEKIPQAAGITSDAVARRTGKNWGEWFLLLDDAGARELDHKGIVAILAQRHGVGPWWQQMITVAYEQYRGMREKHETPDGYQVGASKTLSIPLRKLFKMWVESEERRKWLADDRFSISKATSGKSIRARWGRGSSRIDVYFYDKGDGKSQVSVQHNQIDTAEAAEQMKAYWGKKLGALEAALGG